MTKKIINYATGYERHLLKKIVAIVKAGNGKEENTEEYKKKQKLKLVFSDNPTQGEDLEEARLFYTQVEREARDTYDYGPNPLAATLSPDKLNTEIQKAIEAAEGSEEDTIEYTEIPPNFYSNTQKVAFAGAIILTCGWILVVNEVVKGFQRNYASGLAMMTVAGAFEGSLTFAMMSLNSGPLSAIFFLLAPISALIGALLTKVILNLIDDYKITKGTNDDNRAKINEHKATIAKSGYTFFFTAKNKEANEARTSMLELCAPSQ